MKIKHSTAWKASAQPRKQRKYRYNAPLHTRSAFLTAHLSKDLRAKHGIRSIRVRSGDKVRIVRGQFKDREGKIERVNVRKCVLYVSKVDTLKKDGATRSPYPLDPSNVMIVELDAGDKRRNERIKARAEQHKTK